MAYYSVKQIKGFEQEIEESEKKISDLKDVVNNLIKEGKETKNLLIEMDLYLDINKYTNISSGSLFHQQIKGLLNHKKLSKYKINLVTDKGN